jgi:abequosyltransferase
MKIPLLSICIATYNRANYIGETLDSIILQLTDEVEVIIVDGASTDNTKEVVESYVFKNKQIKYIRLPIKGGVDYDYCKAIEFAKGKMCWLFTDDDILKPDTLNSVLESIRKNFVLIIVNSEIRNKDFSFVLDNNVLKIDRDSIFKENDFELLFTKTISYISFIGCVIVNRELWIEREKTSYFGSEFIHVGVIFQKHLPGPTLLLSNPHIVIRYGNALWSKRAFEIGVIKWPKLINSFKHLSADSKTRFNLSKFKHWLNSFVFHRALGTFSFQNYKIIYKNKDYSILRKSISLFILLFPVSFIKSIVILYYNFFQKDKKIIIYDLENSRK